MREKLKYLIPLALLAYLYYPAALWMYDRWMAKDSYYGHGFLIPLVTLYWIFKKRDRLAAAEKRNDSWGILLLVFGGALQLISSALRFYFLSAFSFVIILLGGIDFLFGRKALREIWFPICFLALMIPLPLLMISEITLKMKFFVSEISMHLINICGIRAIREGSYIYTPHSVLLVADPCSGLRSFLAFLCLGLVFAYDSQFAFWKRLILAAAGLPLAILSNVIRVCFLGLVGEIYGMQYTGPGALPHDASGIAVFVFAFLIFLLIRKKLEVIRD